MEKTEQINHALSIEKIARLEQALASLDVSGPEYANLAATLAQLLKEIRAVRSFAEHQDRSISAIPNFNDRTKLQIGGGSRLLDGYVNVDVFEPADMVWDVRYGIPFPDNRFEEIFTEHFFEHLQYPHAATNVLKEMYRVLNPGGKLFLAVPDCGAALKAYANNDTEYFAMIHNTCFARRDPGVLANTHMDLVNLLFRDQYDSKKYTIHWWGYDEHNLTALLHSAGFKDIHRTDVDASRCNPKREPYTIYMQATK